jgi:nucleotide-binding universal stress UspA family protein
VGLPETGEAVVVTVAEVWLPPNGAADQPVSEAGNYIEDIVRKQWLKSEDTLHRAVVLAQNASARVRRSFPNWKVSPLATNGSPAWEILTAADEFDPDLIIVGSQGHSLVGRLLLGSVSQKVMTEAHCSVRIARGRVEVDPSPGRIVIGYDGSPGATEAVSVAARRNWPPDSEIRMVVVNEDPTDERYADDHWLEKSAKAVEELSGPGLKVTTRSVAGDPKRVLVAEAETWHADSIFVGANYEGSRLARFLLGTTSSAVAARAHCSVEVVRTKHR